MKSLRVKMTILIALVVLISSGLLFLIGYQKTKSSMTAQLEDKYGIAVDGYAQELSAWVNGKAMIVETLAAQIETDRLYERSYDDFHAFLSDYCDKLNTEGYIYDIYYTYPDNHMACATNYVNNTGIDYVGMSDWYYVAAETDDLFYSTPYKDSDTGLPIITISRAIFNDGKLQGVIAADIFVDTLVRIVSEADLPGGGYAFLVDKNLGMVVHPNEDYAFTDKPTGVMDVYDSPYAAVVENIISNSQETVYVKDYDGVTRGIVISKIDDMEWYVGVATGREEIMEGIGSLTRGFMIGMVVAVAIGGLFAVVLAFALDKMSRQQQTYEAHVLKLEKQAADEASRAKSKFLADMSHEIRTPINAILGMNEMVLRESNDRDILTYSTNIKQSGHMLLQLINSILDFSKIEDGKMEITPAPYSVFDQIAFYKNPTAQRAAAKGLEYIVNIDENIPCKLYGDDIRINQVIMNLLTNAVKYTEKGSVTLTVKEIDRKKNEEVLLHFEVKDTGIGIKESEMGRLFESFERLDVTRNRNIEGTGLGMAISTSLLKLMGSELKVVSKYGEGSTFSFDLWQKIVDSSPLGDYKTAIEDTGTVTSYRESFHAPDARILVVDDTPLNITVVLNLLKETQIQSDTAVNGDEAIALASKVKYDLILMDQRMPGIDGSEAMKKIKEIPDGVNRKTPFICLTADVIIGARERYLAEGFDDYLTKPVDGLLLEQMMMAYLPKSKFETVMVEEYEKTPGKEAFPEYFKYLSDIGLDTRQGMEFCRNDIKLYRSTLGGYAAEHSSRSAKLEEYYEKKDWKNYGIYVHSLKSSSKMIGAMHLSELAAESEKAAHEENIGVIDKNHETILDMYGKLVASIVKNLEPSDIPDDDNEEIFDFMPSGDDLK